MQQITPYLLQRTAPAHYEDGGTINHAEMRVGGDSRRCYRLEG